MDAADTFLDAEMSHFPTPADGGETTVPQVHSPFLLGEEEPAPSRTDLLRRAAELGPRMTWESIVVPSSDPVLGEKMLPHVAERRARFRTIVKGALGACIAFCGLAMIIGAVAEPATSAAATGASSIRTAPATAIVSVAGFDDTARPKAQPTKTWSPAPLAPVSAMRAPKADKQRRR